MCYKKHQIKLTGGILDEEIDIVYCHYGFGFAGFLRKEGRAEIGRASRQSRVGGDH